MPVGAPAGLLCLRTSSSSSSSSGVASSAFSTTFLPFLVARRIPLLSIIACKLELLFTDYRFVAFTSPFASYLRDHAHKPQANRET